MTAISIHIGLNQVDPGHYQGWSGQLRGCENDARDMKAIADARGYASQLILTRDATSDRVLQALAEAARGLKAGDALLLSYSGHGGQVPDTNGDEDDGKDETWVLYDRMLVDDELYGMWSQFQPGVRIFMLSDSCHSGTIDRDVLDAMASRGYDGGFGGAIVEQRVIPRIVPPIVLDRTYRANRLIYDAIQWRNFQGQKVAIGASVILISGCQDSQTSGDGVRNGVFTEQLLKVWDRGAFRGDLPAFYRAIVAGMPTGQTPNYDKVGAADPAFESQLPFTPASGTNRNTNPGATMAQCTFSLDVVNLPDNATENDVRKFLLTDGCDTLLDAYLKTRQLRSDVVSTTRSLPKDGSASLECHADSHGGWGCSGGVSVRF